MRRVGLMDLYHAARAVEAAPLQGREAVCRDLLCRAHVADKYLKRLGKTHPLWGDGSLRGAALAGRREIEHQSMSVDFRACLALVLEVLAERHLAIARR